MKIDVRSLFFLLTITDIISTKRTNQEVGENIRSGKISPFDFSNHVTSFVLPVSHKSSCPHRIVKVFGEDFV